MQVHVAAIRIAARLTLEGKRRDRHTEREKERKERMGGEIINDGHRQTRAHFYQEEVEERKKEEY